MYFWILKNINKNKKKLSQIFASDPPSPGRHNYPSNPDPPPFEKFSGSRMKAIKVRNIFHILSDSRILSGHKENGSYCAVLSTENQREMSTFIGKFFFFYLLIKKQNSNITISFWFGFTCISITITLTLIWHRKECWL